MPRPDRNRQPMTLNLAPETIQTVKQLAHEADIYPGDIIDAAIKETAMLKAGRKIIDGYRINVTRAYRMDEVGVGYSLSPWEGDGRYYDGDCQPVRLSVPEDTITLDEAEYADYLSINGEVYHLSEALGLGLARVLTSPKHYTERLGE